MHFTRDEFDIMVNELLYSEPISFNMLCRIAEKTLRSSVIRWCKTEACLCGRGYEDDIMQEIHLRLIKTTVTYFLLRDGIDSPYNDDPEGFENWMFRVAENMKRSFANALRKTDFETEDIDDPSVPDIPDDDGSTGEWFKEKLKEAFSIVLSLDIGIYKILTWVAQMVFILDLDITKIKSNELIITAFENKTLDEMYEMILIASARIPWLVITDEQNEKILKSLRKKQDDGVLYGETKYRVFFMKKDGEVAGKKSISDWVNRINHMIRQKAKSGSNF